MPRGRQLAPLILDEESEQLPSRSPLCRSVLRAKMILASAEGLPTPRRRRVGASPQAVMAI